MTGLKASKPGRLAFAEAGSEGRIGRNSVPSSATLTSGGLSLTSSINATNIPHLPLQVGLTQTISFLLETRGIGLGPQHFLRRTATMRTMIASIVDSAVEYAEQVRKTVEGGRRRWIRSKEELVLRDQATTGLRDVRLCSPAKGRCEIRQIEWHSYVGSCCNCLRVADLIQLNHATLRGTQDNSDQACPDTCPTGSIPHPPRLGRRCRAATSARPPGRDDWRLI